MNCKQTIGAVDLAETCKNGHHTLFRDSPVFLLTTGDMLMLPIGFTALFTGILVQGKDLALPFSQDAKINKEALM